jgi:cell wall assembly regulator SMI1
MEEKIQALISLLKQSVKNKDKLGLNPGATDQEIDKIEDVSGQSIPNDLKVFLKHINGQQPFAHWFIRDQVNLLS